MITVFAPATAHSDSIVRLSCSKCLTARTLKLLLGKSRRWRSRLLRLGERYGYLPID